MHHLLHRMGEIVCQICRKSPIRHSTLIITLFFFICLSALPLREMALADGLYGQPSQNGSGGVGGSNGTPTPTPLMPGFGSTFGGGDPSKPFKPIRSGLQRLASAGYSAAQSKQDCRRFPYKSNPPTSGLYTPDYFLQNDLVAPVSSCTLVHVFHKGNIAIFYDPSRLDQDTLSSIRGLGTQLANGQAFQSQEQFGYAVVLIRSKQYQSPILFATWLRLLPMKSWDSLLVNRFVSSYLGNPKKGNMP